MIAEQSVSPGFSSGLYLQHFHLRKAPFSLTPDPDFLFLTQKHQKALNALRFGLAERKGFLVMTAEAGTGKTTLLRKLITSLPADSTRVSILTNPTLTRSELLESILFGFGERQVPPTKPMRLALLRRILLDADRLGQIAAVIVDEAHLLSAKLIEELRLLSNFETNERKLLQILLVGQPLLNDTLEQPIMTQVKQRLAIRVRLGSLSKDEIDRYISERWKCAGGKQPHPFSKECTESVLRFSGGIPRLVNVICDGALVMAYRAQTTVITVQTIWDVAQNLRLSPRADIGDIELRLLPKLNSQAESTFLYVPLSSQKETLPVTEVTPRQDNRIVTQVSQWVRSAIGRSGRKNLRIT